MRRVAHAIAAIGEATSRKALDENGIRQPIPHRVARYVGIAHRYCDPDRALCVRIEIAQENDIREPAFLNDEGKSEIQAERPLKVARLP